MLKITSKFGHVEHVHYVDNQAEAATANALAPAILMGIFSVGGLGLLMYGLALIIEHYSLLYASSFGLFSLIIKPICLLAVGFLIYRSGCALSAIHNYSVRAFYAFGIPIALIVFARYFPYIDLTLENISVVIHSLFGWLSPSFFMWLDQEVLSNDLLRLPKALTNILLRVMNDTMSLGIAEALFVCGFALIFWTIISLFNKYQATSKALNSVFKYGFIIGFGAHFYAYFCRLILFPF